MKRLLLWLAPGMGVKRHLAVAMGGGLLAIVGVLAWSLWAFDEERRQVAEPLERALGSGTWDAYGGWIAVLTALLGIGIVVIAVGRLNRSLLSNWLPHPDDAALLHHLAVEQQRGVVGVGEPVREQ